MRTTGAVNLSLNEYEVDRAYFLDNYGVDISSVFAGKRSLEIGGSVFGSSLVHRLSLFTECEMASIDPIS
jgi:hypothetical protein